jgi:hypothetical protein
MAVREIFAIAEIHLAIDTRERSLDSEADVLEGFGESTPVNPVR